jgi:hypothetical protein
MPSQGRVSAAAVDATIGSQNLKWGAQMARHPRSACRPAKFRQELRFEKTANYSEQNDYAEYKQHL